MKNTSRDAMSNIAKMGDYLIERRRFSASALIAIVFFLNIQAGVAFFFEPHKYTAAYELIGIPGQAAIAGTGLLFLMWNVPYFFALLNPIKYHTSLLQAIIMQTIGVVGESWILRGISVVSYESLHASVVRFLIFDSVGLLLLLAALLLINRIIKRMRNS